MSSVYPTEYRHCSLPPSNNPSHHPRPANKIYIQFSEGDFVPRRKSEPENPARLLSRVSYHVAKRLHRKLLQSFFRFALTSLRGTLGSQLSAIFQRYIRDGSFPRRCNVTGAGCSSKKAELRPGDDLLGGLPRLSPSCSTRPTSRVSFVYRGVCKGESPEGGREGRGRGTEVE